MAKKVTVTLVDDFDGEGAADELDGAKLARVEGVAGAEHVGGVVPGVADKQLPALPGGELRGRAGW